LLSSSIDNESALREKVDEALKVYDEWRKNPNGSGEDGSPAANGASGENAGEASEQTA
jgi:hypothetical protein